MKKLVSGMRIAMAAVFSTVMTAAAPIAVSMLTATPAQAQYGPPRCYAGPPYLPWSALVNGVWRCVRVANPPCDPRFEFAYYGDNGLVDCAIY